MLRSALPTNALRVQKYRWTRQPEAPEAPEAPVAPMGGVMTGISFKAALMRSSTKVLIRAPRSVTNFDVMSFIRSASMDETLGLAINVVRKKLAFSANGAVLGGKSELRDGMKPSWIRVVRVCGSDRNNLVTGEANQS